MTAKLEILINQTSAEIVRQVDDCLRTSSKVTRVQALLKSFSEKLEKDSELLPQPAPQPPTQ